MGSRFLLGGEGGADLSALQNGSFQLNVASIINQDLAVNGVLRSENRKIDVGLVTEDDLAFGVVKDPFDGTLRVRNLMTAYDTTPVNLNQFVAATINATTALDTRTDALDLRADALDLRADALEHATEHMTVLAPDTTAFAGPVATSSLQAADLSAAIELAGDAVEVLASTFRYNGEDVATIGDIPEVTLTSAGGTTSLVNDGVGPALATKGLTAGAGGISLTGAAASVTIDNTLTGASLGGTAAVFANKTGSMLNLRGVTAGVGITVTQNANDITIANSDRGSVVSLVSVGGTSLVTDGTGPGLTMRGITAGVGITVTQNANDITITNAEANTNLPRAGGTMTGPLVQDNATDSTSTITGSIQTDGGLGVVKSITCGGGLTSTGGILIYNDVALGPKTREACLHVICNESEGPIIAEARSGLGVPYKIELRPFVGEITGAITATGRSSATSCDIISWDAGDGGGSVNLGRLFFNLLNAGVQENQVEITTAQTTIKKALQVSATTDSTSTATGALRVSGGLGVALNMSAGSLVTPTINGLTAAGGKFSAYLPVTIPSNMTETPITSAGVGVGSLDFPANTLTLGATYNVSSAGRIKTKAAGDTLRIRHTLNQGLSDVTYTVSSTTYIPITLDLTFTVIAVGPTGTAKLRYYGEATIGTTMTPLDQATNFQFSTTVPNTLNVLATWGSVDAANVYTINQFTVTKTY